MSIAVTDGYDPLLLHIPLLVLRMRVSTSHISHMRGTLCCGPHNSFILSPTGALLIKKLRGLSPRANYTDRAAAAGRRS